MGIFDQKMKTAPLAGRQHENGVGRYLQGSKVRHVQKGGPRLDLGRLRIKTWSKSDFSSAETTWPTLSSLYVIR